MNLHNKLLDNENSEKNDSDKQDEEKEGVDEEDFFSLDNAIDNSEEDFFSEITYSFSDEYINSDIQCSDRDYSD